MEEGLWQTYKDDGVLVYGINNENIQALMIFLEQVQITFPVIRGAPSGYTLFGGISPFPRDYIIDPEGIVQYVATEYRPTEMSAIIDRLLPAVGLDGDEDILTSPLPHGYHLQQNFPNPFNPSTTIRFEIAEGKAGAFVDLSIYDLRGKLVRTLISGVPGEGRHAIHWDGKDDRRIPLPSGSYLYRLKVGDDQVIRKMIMTR
jgi:hypothetical protein